MFADFFMMEHFAEFFCDEGWWGTPVDPRQETKDPGFVRFRSRSDRTEIFIKKYLKTKKLQHFENPPPIEKKA